MLSLFSKNSFLNPQHVKPSGNLRRLGLQSSSLFRDTISFGAKKTTPVSPSSDTFARQGTSPDPQIQSTLPPIAPSLKPTLEEMLTPQIRGPKALSPESVVDHFNTQIQPITADEIQAIVVKMAQKFPQRTQREILHTLARMTQFSKLSDFNLIADFFIQQQTQSPGEGHHLILDLIPPSLSSNMVYLMKKGNFKALNTRDFNYLYDELTPDKKPLLKKYLLFDENVFNFISQYPDIIQLLKEKKVQFVLPEGWSMGISPLAQGSLESLEHRLEKVISQAQPLYEKQCQQAKRNIKNKIDLNKLPPSWQHAVSDVLNQDIRRQLSKRSRQLGEQIVILQNTPWLEACEISISPYAIARRLKPQQITPRYIEKILQKTSRDPIVQQAVLELLVRAGEIYSPRRVGLALQEIHQNVMAFAKEHQITPENIYLVIPERFKSYGLIAHQYQQLNDFPAEKILFTMGKIHHTQQIIRILGQDPKIPKLFVLLDDLAGSGKSMSGFLRTEAKRFLENRPKHLFYLCPVVSTRKARNRILKDPVSLKKIDPQIHFAPHHRITHFRETAYYDKLSSAEKDLFNAIIQNEGFGAAMTNIVFPWMGTDTNTQFWATFMVRPFTLNGKGNKRQSIASAWRRVDPEKAKALWQDKSFEEVVSAMINAKMAGNAKMSGNAKIAGKT
jgi:hypothetical protein